MKTTKARVVAVLLLDCLLSICLLHGAEPPELARLRGTYEAAVERAVKPLTETYIAELAKIQETLTKAGRLDEALAVANEAKLARARIGVSDTPPPEAAAPGAAPKPELGKEMVVTIPANDPNGFRLGPVKKGDVITLQYVDGKWKSFGNIASNNPDDREIQGGDSCRLVFAVAATNGVPGAMFKIVPPETRLKPYAYVVQTTRDDVVLRINENSDRKINPGSVRYRIKFGR